MRFADILNLALSALWQQKMRTLLTTLGVVFGSFVLIASLSIGQGVQETLERESHRHNYLRRIDIWPNWQSKDAATPAAEVPVKGEMSDAKRQRIAKAQHDHQQRLRGDAAWVALTQDKLQALAALAHVEIVVPRLWQSGYAILNNQSQACEIVTGLLDDAAPRQRIVAGRDFETPAEKAILVSEFLLYRCGIIDDAAVNGVVGKKLRLELSPRQSNAGFMISLHKPNGEISREENLALEKIRKQLPAALDKLDLTVLEKTMLQKVLKAQRSSAREVYATEYTIIGVVRLLTEEEQKTKILGPAESGCGCRAACADRDGPLFPRARQRGIRRKPCDRDR